jgi:outer membrane protein
MVSRELKMKKNLWLSAIVSVIVLWSNVSFGEEQKRIGLIDLQRCVQESQEGQKVFEVLKTKKDDLQKRLDMKEKELLDLRKEFEKQAMMLSMDAQEDRKKTIERKTRELEFMLKDSNEEMKRAQEKEQKRILKELEKIIEKIGSEGNYSMILEKRAGGVLYWNKTFDLTDKVVEAYDRMKKEIKK